MHPGHLLREDILPALGRPRVEIDRHLGISRQAFHAILMERASVTPERPLRLGELCGNGPELSLALQTLYDLERLRREGGRNRRNPDAEGGSVEHYRREPLRTLVGCNIAQ
jgi:addiction module HigA family antidote